MSAIEEFDFRPCRDSLTARELTILQLSMEGLTSEEVGKRLFLSYKTVKAQKQNMYRKLHAVNIAHAIAIYLGAVQ